MEYYLIQDTRLTRIADEIRAAYGEEHDLSPSEMEHSLCDINAEIETQNQLIADIITTVNSLPNADECGTDTSDATATANHILSGETAYVKGEKITGNIRTAHGGISEYGNLIDKSYMGAIGINYSVSEPTYISPNTGSEISLTAPLANFGNATAADVVAGKSFTSAAGLRVTGTYTGGSSEDLEALGVLCDWQVMTDTSSFPIVSIINYHPMYYLHCDIWFDGEVAPFVVPPADSTEGTVASYSWADYGVSFSEAGEVSIRNVRWSANE